MSSNTVCTPPPLLPLCWGNDRRNGGICRKWRRAERARGPLSLLPMCCFKSWLVTRHLKVSRMEERKLAQGKVRICRRGKNVQQQLRPGLFPYISPPPSAYSTTHTCLYIHSEHKALSISGPLHIQMPGAEQRNKKYANYQSEYGCLILDSDWSFLHIKSPNTPTAVSVP